MAADKTGVERERTAMRIIGGAFFALALYVAAEGAYVLVTGGPPAPSPLGIAWTAVTCAAMLALAFGKARTGAALGNPVLTTEGRVTLVDAYLAGAVLLGSPQPVCSPRLAKTGLGSLTVVV